MYLARRGVGELVGMRSTQHSTIPLFQHSSSTPNPHSAIAALALPVGGCYGESMVERPVGLKLGNLTLDVPFFQASLSGYSDHSMRALARRFGCPFALTDVMLAKSVAHPAVLAKAMFRPGDSRTVTWRAPAIGSRSSPPCCPNGPRRSTRSSA
jgi:hypothetical protein